MQQSTKYVAIIDGISNPINEDQTHVYFGGEWWEILDDQEGDKFFCPNFEKTIVIEIRGIVGDNAGDSSIVSDIKDGMRVRHSLIPGVTLTVVADEKGPAYTGKEFADDEISLSYAIQERKAGNLCIWPDSSIGELDGVSPGKWYVSTQNSVRSHVEGKEGWEDEIICTYTGGNLANAELIASAPALKQENERLKSALLNLCNIAESETKNLIAWDGADRLDHAIDMGRKAITALLETGTSKLSIQENDRLKEQNKNLIDLLDRSLFHVIKANPLDERSDEKQELIDAIQTAIESTSK